MTEAAAYNVILFVAIVVTGYVIWRWAIKPYAFDDQQRFERRNVAPAPQPVAQLRIACAMRQAPDCRRVIHKGDPGARVAYGVCEPCRHELRARSRSMETTLDRLVRSVAQRIA